MEESRRHLKRAREVVKQSHHELRQSIWNLRATAEEEFDLGLALERFAQTLFQHLDVKIHVARANGRLAFPPLAEEELLRIGQEALTNAFKHANPSAIIISLRSIAEKFELVIEDDGCGISPQEGAANGPEHFGLRGMRERVGRIGGELSIGESAGGGTQVRVMIPMPKHRANVSPQKAVTKKAAL